MSMNVVMILGNLGDAPEFKKFNSGKMTCSFSVATSEVYYDKDGEKKEETEWHRVVAWGKQAENCAKYLTKGSQVLVQGSNKTRSYEDNDGNKKFIHEIVADNIRFLNFSAKKGGDLGGGKAPSAPEVITSVEIPF